MENKMKLDIVESEIIMVEDLRVTLKKVLRVDSVDLEILEDEVLRVEENKGIETVKRDGESLNVSREIKELRERITKWKELIKAADGTLVGLAKSRETILKEQESKSFGFGVNLLGRDDVVSLVRGEDDELFVSEIERLLRAREEFPYGLDEKILTIFGENRRLYDKMLAFEDVRLLIEKNDFYVAEEYEIALKIYDMVYSGNISDKEYLKEYLSYNGRVMDKELFDAAVKDIEDCGEVWDGENDKFNPGNMDEMFDRLIKWW